MAIGQGAALLPPGLRADIEDAIRSSGPAWSQFISDNLEDPQSSARLPLAVKYVPSRFAGTYKSANPGLFIGSSNFTWAAGYMSLACRSHSRRRSTAELVSLRVSGHHPPAWTLLTAPDTRPPL